MLGIQGIFARACSVCGGRVLAGAAALLTLSAQANPTTVNTLHSFSGPDGSMPQGALLLGSDGNFYGATTVGGTTSSSAPLGDGTVFRITLGGVLTTLYQFSGSDGARPNAGLIQGSDGSLYGTTAGDSVNNDGTVFRLAPDGTFSTLHTFTGSDGAQPNSSLILGSDGALYGTTGTGGAANDGTAFRLALDGTFSTLYSFSGADGQDPQGLVLGSDGNFYGTTQRNNAGHSAVYRLTPAGVLTFLHTFNGTDGDNALGGLALGPDGYFYGTTSNGGATGDGTLYKISPTGSFTSLYSFVANGDGWYPYAAPVLAADGKWYGTTASSVYVLEPDGTVVTLYNGFNGDADPPSGSPVGGGDGNFYGAIGGGSGAPPNPGAIYQLQPSASPPPTVSLSASAQTAQMGQNVTLTWSSTGAQSCNSGWNANGTSGSQSVTVSLYGPNTYTLSCTGDGGTVTAVVVVTGWSTPQVTLSASASSAAVNSNVTLTWGVSYADSCTASGGWSGSIAPQAYATQSVPVANAGPNNYTLSCSNAHGSAAQTVTVTGVPAPTITLSASPTTVADGQSTTLSWSTTNASSCSAAGSWSGSEPTSGSQSVSEMQTGSYSFILNCSGTGGGTSQTVTVSFVPPPSIALTANPYSVPVGQTSTLSWSTGNATSCTASGGWSGSEATSGSQAVVISKAGANSYTLTCSSNVGSSSQTVTVTGLPPPTVSLAASPSSLEVGQATTLTWSSTNATSCSASGAWSGSLATSGSQSVTVNNVGANSYTLSCAGSGGSAAQTVTVTGQPIPTVSLSASPTSVLIGNSTTLSWSSSNTTACSASGAWSGSVATSGSQSVTVAGTGSNSYTLSCTGPGGSISQQIIVTGVLPTVSFATAAETATASKSGAVTVNLAVNLSAAIPYAVTAPYTTGGTESASGYSVSPSGSLSIPAGATSATLTVGVSAAQCNKTVVLSLGTPHNANLGSITSNTLTLKTAVACK